MKLSHVILGVYSCIRREVNKGFTRMTTATKEKMECNLSHVRLNGMNGSQARVHHVFQLTGIHKLTQVVEPGGIYAP